jgi:mono/diheme cytochrome c family protein
MRRSLSPVSLAACAAAALTLVAGIATSVSAARPALYTKAQAAAGAKAYAANCAVCHGAKLQGVTAPALKGKDSPITGIRTVADVYGFASTQMPLGKPGSLSPATYAAILAYLLQQNGHPAGTRALTPSAAQHATEKM